ncbi:hypothetical protein GCM10011575_26060 [Microlunatus endophyticus]|uniref:Uridine kinase n=1 Tax=Microlunatus endophyticus TaxID=1716077 RepID=A0A917SA05_9ACTN|nr:hypothetical protein [Microlunatus endophyticus]GGL66330.1 hypothetical protein GCM10011575_26060 [Microlunatus endophyticus]
MHVAPGSSEPTVTDWRPVTVDELVGEFPSAGASTRIVAVDGRSASGKTTLAERLNAAIANSAIIHTDDVAWCYSMFDWSQLLEDKIIDPARQGEPVRYQPPGWEPNGRSGALELPAGLDTVIIEGVGAGRRELSAVLDVLVWVQSDFPTAHVRGLERDIASGVNGGPVECQEFWDHWMRSEIPFLDNDRPWERADFIVAGTGGPVGPDAGDLTVAVHPTTPPSDR